MFSGCDTASVMYGTGKSTVSNKIYQSLSRLYPTERDVLELGNATPDDVYVLGIQLLAMQHVGKSGGTLNHLRCVLYIHQPASRSRPRSEWLHPTDKSAHFHLPRVRLKIIQK